MKLVMPCLLAIAITARIFAQEAVSEAAQLVKQLGDEDYNQREAAERALLALGNKALPALKEMAKSSEDSESRQRAKSILEMLEDGGPAQDGVKIILSADRSEMTVKDTACFVVKLVNLSAQPRRLFIGKEQGGSILEVGAGFEIRQAGSEKIAPSDPAPAASGFVTLPAYGSAAFKVNGNFQTLAVGGVKGQTYMGNFEVGSLWYQPVSDKKTIAETKGDFLICVHLDLPKAAANENDGNAPAFSGVLRSNELKFKIKQ